MFILPSKAYVHREYPLKDVYKAIGADQKLIEASKNIKKIYIEYVFNLKNTNLEAKSVKEIHFYKIELSDFHVPEDFILALDKKDKFQVVFIITCENLEKDMTAPKRINGEEVTKAKYIQSDWMKIEDDVEIPPADTLDELYCFLYGAFNEYKPFKGELLENYITRSNELRKLDYQISKTTMAIQNERQSKKRIEYNHNLNEYKERKSYLLNQRRMENAEIISAIEGFVSGEHKES